MKRGKQSKAEMIYITSNPTMSDSELAQDLNRTVKFVQALRAKTAAEVKSMPDEPPKVDTMVNTQPATNEQFNSPAETYNPKDFKQAVKSGRISRASNKNKTIGVVSMPSMSEGSDKMKKLNKAGPSRYEEGSIYKPFTNDNVRP